MGRARARGGQTFATLRIHTGTETAQLLSAHDVDMVALQTYDTWE